ncbi:type I-F CRISPR-associated protein Csy3 [uncultured Acidaminococcus sp.]|uniref:type I-F CRISPR-associated protein Csy3 n=1 Tax=uncultured Acidaminococcus sp. TaxID=352152 RepID=UPI0026DD2D94|nr:type I-F CRISPR-associated protein Csy3 [uncultured Acidaminococcus sp.]
MAKTNERVSVLAYEKKLVLSDGYFYGTTWDAKDSKTEKIPVVEKAVRGTISNRLPDTTVNDPAKMHAEVNTPNLQTVDTASLKPDQDTLKVTFTLKVLSGVQYPVACNNEKRYDDFVMMAKSYIDKTGCSELGKRYALNLANGRFLWKNRVGAEKLQVKVTLVDDKNQGASRQWIFDPYQYSLENFDATDSSVVELGQIIAEALAGKRDYIILNVEGYALMGLGQEVYPSQELIPDKDKGSADKKNRKSKILYQSYSTAAMHSQKLGNAIRTIDTWYPAYGEDWNRPISVETYGTVSTMGRAFRGNNKKDFYTLFDDWSNGKNISDEEKNYVIAVLIRGGVFGDSKE